MKTMMLLIIVLFGAFNLITLDAVGFWADEMSTLESGRLPFVEMVAHRAQAGHPPLYFSLSWCAQRALGEHETALRLPALIGGLLSIALLYLLV